MRFGISILLFLLLLGCTGTTEPGNATENHTDIPPGNATENLTPGNFTGGNITNQTPAPRYLAPAFSFEYPSGMTVEESRALFTATSALGGQTRELVIASYLDTEATYGPNQDELFRRAPTRAASDLLQGDLFLDPLDILDRAHDVGETSTFSISRDAYVATASFKFRPEGFSSVYTGHAFDIYIPERSTLVRVRLMALDPAVAESMKSQFLLSFRVE